MWSYETAVCRGCGLQGRSKGWFSSPLGYYCAVCAMALPPAAQNALIRLGSAKDFNKAYERIKKAKEEREREKQARRVFAEAIGESLPPEAPSSLLTSWWIKA